MTAPLHLRLYGPDRFDKNDMPFRPRHGMWISFKSSWLVARAESSFIPVAAARGSAPNGCIRRSGTAKARFAIETNSRAREAYRTQTGETGLSLADPTAMAVALDRSIGLSWSRHRIAIETQSELTRGMTVVDRLNVSADENNAGLGYSRWSERRR